ASGKAKDTMKSDGTFPLNPGVCLPEAPPSQELYQPPIFLTLVGFRSSHLFECQILCCWAAASDGGHHGVQDRGDAAGAVGAEASAAGVAQPGRSGSLPHFGDSPCARRIVTGGGGVCQRPGSADLA